MPRNNRKRSNSKVTNGNGHTNGHANGADDHDGGRPRTAESTTTTTTTIAGNDLDVSERTRRANEELTRLSILMGVDDEQEVLTQLRKKRDKVKGDPRKARLIDELLTHTSLAKTNERTMTNGRGREAEEEEENVAAAPKQKAVRPVRPSSSAARTAEEAAAARRRTDDSVLDRSILSGTRFGDLTPRPHSASLRAVADVMGLQETTEVQAKTYRHAVEGKDVLARARTGTGKTLAFLLPAIEVVLRAHEASPERRGTSVEILVVSPTRELAAQIHNQAEKLLTFHGPDVASAQVVYGGTKIGGDTAKFGRRLPTVLVATPGRLRDHLESTRVQGRAFAECVAAVKVLVLDETDRLLDMGFRKEIRDIVNRLGPPRNRQTLLFSATLPPALRSVMEDTMRKGDSVTVDCVKDDGAHTNTLIRQSYAVASDFDDHVSVVVRTVLKAVRDDNRDDTNKIVAFFPTARMVGFFANLFNKHDDLPDVGELHSKKSQGHRNRVSDAFRAANSTAVLFTSDVSARGVDYPDVTHVLQVSTVLRCAVICCFGFVS